MELPLKSDASSINGVEVSYVDGEESLTVRQYIAYFWTGARGYSTDRVVG